MTFSEDENILFSVFIQILANYLLRV